MAMMLGRAPEGHKPGLAGRLGGGAIAGWCGFVWCGLLWCAPAVAQVASQITPQSFAPPIQGGLGGGASVGASPGLDTPPGADKLFVTLRGVTIEGGFPQLAPEAEALRARLMGRRVSGAEIFAAARDLEAAYARAGYVLVRVTLPQQKIVNGADLRLLVIDGTIERVETRNVPSSVRGRIASLVEPLVGVHPVMLRDLERRILLAGDVPGVVLRSALAPGSVTGATVLVIEANYQPVNGIFSADNSLSRQLGTFQIGVGGDFNSLLGLGELAYIRATGDPNSDPNGIFSDYPRNRILAAGLIIPIGNDGLTFNVEGTLARTAPEADGGLQSTDQFQRESARLRYPWVRSRNFNFASQLVFDIQDERESILLAPTSLPLFQDRVRVLRLTNEADYLASWGGTFSGTLTPSVGLDVLGARTAANATPTLPLSQQGADATFAKLDGTLGYAQPLAEHLTTSLTARGQTSFGSALVRSEQIGLAGPGGLSAFDVGTLQGDSGILGRAELAAPYALPNGILPLLEKQGVGVVAAPYVFAAVGELFLSDPTVLERGHIGAASFGAGVRIGGGQAGTLSNGSLALEYARQARSDGVPDANRFNLVAAIRF